MAGGEALKTAEFQGVATNAAPEKPHLTVVKSVQVDRSRDALLTDFGKKTLEDRYLLPGESYQDMFARVSTAFSDDADHAQRLYDYMSRLWFMPATPVLSNGGADRGLPISCFLNAVGDSLNGIVDVWNENVWLAANGGDRKSTRLNSSHNPASRMPSSA
jgi:ribonucleoside-diphosphate reductase alpha chain